MKKIFLIFIALLGAAIGYLAVAGSKLQEITADIEIAAPPSKVWSILADIDNWQEWSPIIDKSRGTAAVGAQLKITMTGKEPGKEGPAYITSGIAITNDAHFI